MIINNNCNSDKIYETIILTTGRITLASFAVRNFIAVGGILFKEDTTFITSVMKVAAAAPAILDLYGLYQACRSFQNSKSIQDAQGQRMATIEALFFTSDAIACIGTGFDGGSKLWKITDIFQNVTPYAIIGILSADSIQSFYSNALNRKFYHKLNNVLSSENNLTYESINSILSKYFEGEGNNSKKMTAHLAQASNQQSLELLKQVYNSTSDIELKEIKHDVSVNPIFENKESEVENSKERNIKRLNLVKESSESLQKINQLKVVANLIGGIGMTLFMTNTNASILAYTSLGICGTMIFGLNIYKSHAITQFTVKSNAI